jgi:gliding motility-associated-like protein
MDSIRFWCFLFACIISPLISHAQAGMQEGILNLSAISPEKPVYLDGEVFEFNKQEYFDHPELGKLPFNAGCDDCFEILQERTIDSRLFYKKHTNGSEFYKQQFYGPVHFQNEKQQWVTIDPRLKPSKQSPNIFSALQQPLPVVIDLGSDFTSIQLKDKTIFKFNEKIQLYYIDKIGNKIQEQGRVDLSNFTAGDQGILNYEAWKSINRQCMVERGEVEVNYIVKDSAVLPGNVGFMVFEETFHLPEGFILKKDVNHGFTLEHGGWVGDIVLLDKNGDKLAVMKKPVVYDSNPNGFSDFEYPIFYELSQTGDEYVLLLKISVDWLKNKERVYPVVIDPVVKGSSRYNVGYMGFQFDPVCFDTSNYCSFPLRVVVPGKSTLVGAWFDARYNSKNSGCGIGTMCRKKDAAFKIKGPCGISPSQQGFWTCDSSKIISTIPGLCYGDSIPMFGPISCLPPSCPDHIIDFEMQTFHCSCPLPACDSACHVMRTGTWAITIAARTLEGWVDEDDVVCLGDSKILWANGRFGVPPYTYAWAPGGQTTRTDTVMPLTTTNYFCTITDQCNVSVVDNALLQVVQKPTLSFNVTDAICSGSNDGAIAVTASGTAGPYQYEWNTSPPQTTLAITNLKPGWYTVSVTDSLGCVKVDSIEVGFQNQLIINSTVDPVSCFGFNDGQIALNPIGTPGYTFQWGDGSSNAFRDSLVPGRYFVTVTDAIGCSDTVSFEIIEPPPFSVDAGMDQSIIAGSSVVLNPTIVPPANYVYTWSPSAFLNNANIENPIAAPDSSILYIITVSRPGNPDCFEMDSIRILIIPETEIYIPNAFTPNGDGKNDLFLPSGDLEIIDIQIFNRWGALVYQGINGWDGKNNGIEQPMGTYVYIIIVKSPYLEIRSRVKGNVTLIR